MVSDSSRSGVDVAALAQITLEAAACCLLAAAVALTLIR